MWFDDDEGQAICDIALELGTSHQTIVKAIDKFRRLMREELIEIGIIEGEEYCK